jgi:hypothetical protein
MSTATPNIHYSPIKIPRPATNIENKISTTKPCSENNMESSHLISAPPVNELSKKATETNPADVITNKKDLTDTNLNNPEGSSSKSSFDDSKFDDDVPELELKNDQILTIKSFQQTFSLNVCNENSYAEIHSDSEMSVTKILHNEEDVNAYNTVPNEESDDELLGINDSNIKPVEDDDVEFQKFMNSDTTTK